MPDSDASILNAPISVFVYSENFVLFCLRTLGHCLHEFVFGSPLFLCARVPFSLGGSDLTHSLTV